MAFIDSHDSHNHRPTQEQPSPELKVHKDVKGLAQEGLALDAGVDRTVVSKTERAVTNPSLEILLRLANQLDVEVGQLLIPPTDSQSK